MRAAGRARLIKGIMWGVFAVGGVIFATVALPIAPVNPHVWNVINGELKEEIGWPELVETVARIYDALPAEDKLQAGILTGNYGEAGVIIWHVMHTNTYLSSWARIQEDRGQVVIKEGLHRYIRHPMYLGIILAFLGIPFVLASWWAMIPSGLIVCLFVYRTIREDRMLAESLPGYAEYKEEARYRLIPGIW